MIFGSNFTSDATVLFDGEPLLDVVYISAEELQATTVPHAPGAVDIEPQSRQSGTPSVAASRALFQAPQAP